MYKNSKIALFIFTIMVYGCYKTKLLDENTIYFNFKTDQEIGLDELIDTITYVNLGTKANYGNYNRVKCIPSFCVYLTGNRNELTAFERNGNILWKINQKNYPNIPRNIRDFVIDKELRQILLYDTHTKTIFRYDFSGNFITDNQLISNDDYHHDFFSSDRHGNLYFHILGMPGSGSIQTVNNQTLNYVVTRINKESFGVNQLYIQEGGAYRNSILQRFFFTSENNNLLFIYPFSNNVYSLDSNSIHIKYRFDSSLWVDREKIVELDKIESTNIHKGLELGNKIKDNGICEIKMVHEFNDFLLSYVYHIPNGYRYWVITGNNKDNNQFVKFDIKSVFAKWNGLPFRITSLDQYKTELISVFEVGQN